MTVDLPQEVIEEIVYASQKADRLAADLDDGGVSFTRLIHDARLLIGSVRELRQRIPASEPERE